MKRDFLCKNGSTRISRNDTVILPKALNGVATAESPGGDHTDRFFDVVELNRFRFPVIYAIDELDNCAKFCNLWVTSVVEDLPA